MARSIQGAYLYIRSHIHSNGKGLYERLQVHFRFTSRDNGKGGIKFFSLNEREEVNFFFKAKYMKPCSKHPIETNLLLAVDTVGNC